MWTMVDGQADHTLTHNRPERERGTPETLRAQQVFFWITAKTKAPPKRGLLSDMACFREHPDFTEEAQGLTP